MGIVYNTKLPKSKNLLFMVDAANPKSYPGSDATGATWFDVTGNGVNFTLLNGPAYGTDDSKYIRFDGSDDYAVAAGSGDVFPTTNNITISMWVKLLSVSATNKQMFGKPGWSYTGFHYDVSYDSSYPSTESGFQIYAIDNYEAGPATKATINEWFNVTYIYNGSYQRWYWNGEIANTNATTGTLRHTGNWYIGANNGAEPTYAKYAICACWDQALSNEEVKQFYEAYRGRFGVY